MKSATWLANRSYVFLLDTVFTLSLLASVVYCNTTVSISQSMSQKSLSPNNDLLSQVCRGNGIADGHEVMARMINEGCSHGLPYFIRCKDNTYQSFEPQCSAGKVIYMIACGVLGVLITGGNLMVIAVFLRKKSLRNSQGIYKLAIAVSDFVFGLVVPFFIILSWQLRWNGPPFNNSFVAFITSFSTFSSLGNLVISGVDRALAIYLLTRYNPLLAKRSAKVAIVIVWISAGLISALPFYSVHVWYTYSSTGTVQFLTGRPVVVICLGVSVGLVWLNGIFVFIFVKVRQSEISKVQKSNRFRRDARLTITLCIMTATFSLSTMPLIVFMLVNPFRDSPALLTAEAIVVYLFMTNGFWNCIVYSLRNQNFRREAKRILGISTGRNLRSSSNNDSSGRSSVTL